MTLFLYGTLLPGFAPPLIAATVARLRPLGPATVPGQLKDLGRYPGLVADDASRVVGELVAASDELLAELDEYEGHLFRRVPATATTPAGELVSCWLYEYAGDVSGAVVIAGGDYRRWCIMMLPSRAGDRLMHPIRFTAVVGPDRTIRLPEDVTLEPGPVAVEVTPKVEPPPTSARDLVQRLANIARELNITDLPADLAENNDHYAHGAPKGIDRS